MRTPTLATRRNVLATSVAAGAVGVPHGKSATAREALAGAHFGTRRLSNGDHR